MTRLYGPVSGTAAGAALANNDAANRCGPVEVGRLLDTNRFGGLAALVATFTTLTFVFDGFDIQAIAFSAPSLLVDWRIDRSALAPVLAAGLLGMGLGALALGTVGDRIGRRRALIISLVLVAIASLASAYTSRPGELAFCRLLTGIGLGGTLPNATALIAEFSPRAVRNLLVTVAVVGVPIGGMLGAAVAADIIPRFGWRSIFIAGAALPGLLAVAAVFLLPESPRYLTVRRERWPELADLLNRLTRSQHYRGDQQFHIQDSQQASGRTGVAVLFAREFRYDTLMVWIIFFTNVFAVYAIFNWLPTVLSAAGLQLATAIRGSLLFNLGGVFGALASAALMTPLGSRRVLSLFAVGAVASTFSLGLIPLSREIGVATLQLVMVISGACIIALQVGMYSVAAYVYPTVSRASGLGWALGVARIGGILSAFAGSALLALGNPTMSFFSGIAAVLVLTLLGVLLLKRQLPPAILDDQRSG
jgi:AAHS family 4-hydroxybenzoate transporter-like MFS transporter